MQTAPVNCCSLLLFIFCSQFLFTFSLHNFCSQFLSKFCSHHCSQLLYTTFIHKFWPQFHNFWLLLLLFIDVRNLEFFLRTFVHIFHHNMSPQLLFTTFVYITTFAFVQLKQKILYRNRMQKNLECVLNFYCQAQPQPQLPLSWAEIALISSKTPARKSMK